MHEEINACGEQKVSMPLNLGDISITEMACPNGPNEQPNVKLSVIVPSIAPPVCLPPLLQTHRAPTRSSTTPSLRMATITFASERLSICSVIL